MSTRIVLDASAAVRLVMGMDEGGRIGAVLERAGVVIAPGLFVSEVANALRGYVAAGAISRDEAVDRVEEAFHLIDEVVADQELGVEALSESTRLGHPAYDLFYAVLARRTGASVLTRDRRLTALLVAAGMEPALQD